MPDERHILIIVSCWQRKLFYFLPRVKTLIPCEKYWRWILLNCVSTLLHRDAICRHSNIIIYQVGYYLLFLFLLLFHILFLYEVGLFIPIHILTRCIWSNCLDLLLEGGRGYRKVCLLRKSLYGLKQSSRTWFGKFRDVI